MSAYITDILDENNNTIYPTTKYNAVFDSNGSTLPSDFGKLEAHPIGSIYMSLDSTSPASLFGGTWERIQGKFILGATDGTDQAELTNLGYSRSGQNYHYWLDKDGNRQNVTAVGNISGIVNHQHKYGIRLGCYYGQVAFEYATNAGVQNYSSQSSYSDAGWSVDGSVSASWNNSTQSSSTWADRSAYKSQGKNSLESNMPPYLVAYVWKRTA